MADNEYRRKRNRILDSDDENETELPSQSYGNDETNISIDNNANSSQSVESVNDSSSNSKKSKVDNGKFELFVFE